MTVLLVAYSQNGGSMEVFILQHVHMIDEDQEEVKLIGVYSTNESAEQAILRMRVKPGFCDAPEGFEICKKVLDKDYWEEGYVTVYPDSSGD